MDHRVFVFTVHKAASLGVYDVMRNVAKKEGWPLHSANLRHPNLVEPAAPGDKAFLEQLNGKTGLVGPVRMPVTLDEKSLARDRIILHLRDPRDVLVSMFYSWSYSHPGVSNDYREDLRRMGIDEFVKRNTPALKQKYKSYADKFLPLPATRLLRYEDFVLDRPRWLEAFLGAAGVQDGMKRYARLANKNPADDVREENIHAHIRKAAPGDHKEKLLEETIGWLNEEWRDLLAALDYAVE